MPIYEYKCLRTNELIVKLMPRSMAKTQVIPCPLHSKLNKNKEEVNFHEAERVWSRTANISLGKPTIIFTNPQTGEKQVATSITEKPPKGFIREELKNPIERARFEKEEAIKQKTENELATHILDQKKKILRDARHDDIKANLSNIVRESNNSSAAESLLKASLNRSRKKGLPPKRTEFKLKINHYDSSNIDKA